MNSEQREKAETILKFIEQVLEHIGNCIKSDNNIINAADDLLGSLTQSDRERPYVAEIGDLVKDCRMRNISVHQKLLELRSIVTGQQDEQAG